MTILILFAFFAGLVTILSPCILPVLPVVLSGSATGGKRRPVSIAIGFIVSFTVFTLFLSTIVRLTGIQADALRLFSIAVIFIFGLVLVIPRLLLVYERVASRIISKTGNSAGTTSAQNGNDVFSGLMIGGSLGLLWTPCVGPILASVITLAASSRITLETFMITLAFSVGTAIPLFLIITTGRSVLLKYFTQKAAGIQKMFGLLMIITSVTMYFQLDRKFQSYILTAFPGYGAGLTTFEDTPFVRDALDRLTGRRDLTERTNGTVTTDTLLYPAAPELIPGGDWFNSDPLTIEGLKGKIILVDFWTYTCINCIRTLPYLTKWDETYRDRGLVIIGVHTPEFEFEKISKNVEKAISDFGIRYPVVQDNRYDTWNAYDNRYWPAKYLIDRNGRIRYTHFGEGKYDETELMITELLNEAGGNVTEDIRNPSYEVMGRTPELYLGYGRIRYLASPEDIERDKKAAYSIPPQFPIHYFAYSGDWVLTEEHAQPDAGGKLVLRFDAASVYLVMRPVDVETPATARILLDGADPGQAAGADVTNNTVTVSGDKLFKLIDNTSPGEHMLEIEFPDGNIELYAFTFG